MVVGEKDHRSLHLDLDRALRAAVSCHGVVKGMVFEEDVKQLVADAFHAGAERGQSRKE
jgi:hypothetical protein